MSLYNIYSNKIKWYIYSTLGYKTYFAHLEEHHLNLTGTDKGLNNNIFSECSSGLKILLPYKF